MNGKISKEKLYAIQKSCGIEDSSFVDQREIFDKFGFLGDLMNGKLREVDIEYRKQLIQMEKEKANFTYEEGINDLGNYGKDTSTSNLYHYAQRYSLMD